MTTWTRHLYEHDPLAIAKGESNHLSVRNISGYQENVTTSFIPAWEYATAYTYPTSAVTMDVASTDTVNDNGYTVRIIGLDANYNIISEDVTIPATTTKAFFRINDVLYFNTDSNQGLITVSNGGTVYAAIRIGDGRNQASIYTVPAGHCFYLYRIDAFSNDSSSSKTGVFKNFTINSSGHTFNVARTTFQNQMNIQHRLPLKYDAKTDIQFQVRTKSGTHEMNVYSEGVLVNEGLDD
tara:strand:+ start:51 stop:764 length:714 start_codon:yes stop_codon:yes gene_type:complete